MEIHSANGLREDLQRAIAEDYTIDREIGRGGMATVFLAQEHHPSRDVAIKVLDPDITTRLTRRRFLREVEVVSNLTHPHIVPIFAAGDKDGLLYYVMPFIEGETLRHRLAREGTIPLEEALRIARDVAEALSHAHEQYVVHRDIKPENILLSSEHAVVADFGVARAITCAECGDEVQPLTKAGLPIGTPLYMAPEQAAGSTELDGRADIYSLGCVLYEMLTGEAPYQGNTMYEIMTRHTQDPIPSVRTPPGVAIPRSVRRAITKAMAKDPRDRFATAPEFADALAVRRSGSDTALSRWPWRKKGLWAGLVASLAVTTALVMGLSHESPGATVAPLDRLLVVPFENQTGDATLDSLGEIAAASIARALAVIEGLQVVELTGSTDPQQAASARQAGAYVWGAYYLQGNTLSFQPRVVDSELGTILASLGPITGRFPQATATIDSVAGDVATAVRQLARQRR